MADDEFDLLTAKEVAEWLKVSLSTVYTLPIPYYKFGGCKQWERADVNAYLGSSRVKPMVILERVTMKVSRPDSKFELQILFEEQALKRKKKGQKMT